MVAASERLGAERTTNMSKKKWGKVKYLEITEKN